MVIHHLLLQDTCQPSLPWQGCYGNFFRIFLYGMCNVTHCDGFEVWEAFFAITIVAKKKSTAERLATILQICFERGACHRTLDEQNQSTWADVGCGSHWQSFHIHFVTACSVSLFSLTLCKYVSCSQECVTMYVVHCLCHETCQLHAVLNVIYAEDTTHGVAHPHVGSYTLKLDALQNTCYNLFACEGCLIIH